MIRQNNNLAFVFPGQGSQQIGMLKEASANFPIIQKTFMEASTALGQDLWDLAQEGPEAALNSTVNTQPVLLTAGVALWRAWQQEAGLNPGFLAGHSLGEYTALVCAGAISLIDAVNVVKLRGTYMQTAVPEGQGAMAAVLGLSDLLLNEVCQEAAQNECVTPANFNAIGQTVIAGNKHAVERACALAKEKGAKKVIFLPVSVPSHCALMKPAALKLESVLKDIAIQTPKIPVIHNVDVKSHTSPESIRRCLVKQLSEPVRWVETIQYFAKEGVNTVLECGPGKVLTGLIKRIEPTLVALAIESRGGFEEALAKALVLEK